MSTEAADIAALATKAANPPQILANQFGRQFLVHPNDTNWKDITEEGSLAKPLPLSTTQHVLLQTVDSLVDYANRFKGDNSILFADIDRNTIVAAIDYHGPQSAARLDHTARMVLPHSVEWVAWREINGKYMGQLEFARFLEENATDILAPTGAELLDVVHDLHALRKVDFKKAVRTASDNENFEYTDQTELQTKGDLELPTRFQLQIPVYFRSIPTNLFAFLRWKVEENKLNLGIQLHRPEHVRQDEFKSIVDDVAARTELPAVFGRPTA